MLHILIDYASANLDVRKGESRFCLGAVLPDDRRWTPSYRRSGRPTDLHIGLRNFLAVLVELGYVEAGYDSYPKDRVYYRLLPGTYRFLLQRQESLKRKR
jgi:hypothetical protein